MQPLTHNTLFCVVGTRPPCGEIQEKHVLCEAFLGCIQFEAEDSVDTEAFIQALNGN